MRGVHIGVLNCISMQYLHQDSSPTCLKIQHPRAEYWDLKRAFNKGDLGDMRLLSYLADNEDPLALGLLAQVYEKSGEVVMAIDIWQELRATHQLSRIGGDTMLADQIDFSIAAYYALWEIDPANGNVTNLVSLLQRKRNDPSAAEQVARVALAAKPAPVYKLSFMVGLGVSLEMQERWDEALQLYNQVVTEFPESSRAYYGLAHSLEKTGAPIESVILAYQQTMRYEPDYWIAYLELGDIFIQQTMVDKAIAAYQDGFSANPMAHPLCYKLALVYKEQGEMTIAAQWIESALDLHVSPTYLRFAGKIYLEVGERDRAMQAYRQLLNQIPDDIEALQALKELENK